PLKPGVTGIRQGLRSCSCCTAILPAADTNAAVGHQFNETDQHTREENLRHSPGVYFVSCNCAPFSALIVAGYGTISPRCQNCTSR
ncbi:hypothetical protein, partial [Escherichia coli]|uniref:hypothetical protein n=1 Tax=Escherichia coli TaxID=562 RepID=UPI003D8145DB